MLRPGRINLNVSTTRHRARPRHKFGIFDQSPRTGARYLRTNHILSRHHCLLPFLAFLETTITLTTVARISTFLDIQYPIPNLTFLYQYSRAQYRIFPCALRAIKRAFTYPFTSAYTGSRFLEKTFHVF